MFVIKDINLLDFKGLIVNDMFVSENFKYNMIWLIIY